jgi:hypothetical protein
MGFIEVHHNGAWILKQPEWSCRRHSFQLFLLLAPFMYLGWYNLVLVHGTFGPHNVWSYFTPYEPPTPYPADIGKAILSPVWMSRPRPRVVVTLSTLPHRMESINETLNSLVQQSMPPDAIYLNVPWVARRMNRTYVVPYALQQWSAITIVRCEDMGPATKLIPALEQVRRCLLLHWMDLFPC